MQLMTHAPTGPWPELSTCPCCGQPWPHRPYGPSPWEPFDLPEMPVPESYEPPTPGPWTLVELPELVTDFPLVSGVSLELVLLLAGELDPL